MLSLTVSRKCRLQAMPFKVPHASVASMSRSQVIRCHPETYAQSQAPKPRTRKDTQNGNFAPTYQAPQKANIHPIPMAHATFPCTLYTIPYLLHHYPPTGSRRQPLPGEWRRCYPRRPRLRVPDARLFDS